MAELSYQVRVTGLFQVEDLQGWLGRSTVPGHLRTVVLASFTAQQGLVELLRHLRSYGLEITEVRRVAGSVVELMDGVAPGLTSAVPLLDALRDALRPEGRLVDLAIALEWRSVRIAGALARGTVGEQNQLGVG